MNLSSPIFFSSTAASLSRTHHSPAAVVTNKMITFSPPRLSCPTHMMSTDHIPTESRLVRKTLTHTTTQKTHPHYYYNFSKDRHFSNLSIFRQSTSITVHPRRRPTFSSPPLNSSYAPSNAGGGSSDNGDGDGDGNGDVVVGDMIRKAPVFVLLPLQKTLVLDDPVKATESYDLLMQWFMSFAHAGVHGVLMEVWWDLVEKIPKIYSWELYLVVAEMARHCGLKVRAVLAFHEYFDPTGSSIVLDYDQFSLPKWVRQEMKRFHLAYYDRFGGECSNYVSLGCDDIPLLMGRTPIQVYGDFMRSFRSTFRSYFGEVMTGIQIGMGPDGELKYPAFMRNKEQPIKLQIGEFQCYDKFMRNSLNLHALSIGKPEWGYNGGPLPESYADAQLVVIPDETFFVGGDKSWSTPYGSFFLEWYSEQLLMHGKRICEEADAIFSGVNVSLSAKVPSIYWHYLTDSHPSELTAGYYNTSTRDGYSAVAQMFSTYGFGLCCSSFDLQDKKERSRYSSPEGFLSAMISTARTLNLPLEGEVLDTFLDEDFIQQVVKMSKLYCTGVEKRNFSFNVRMDLGAFDDWGNWVRQFRRFVREMCDAHVF